MVELIYSVLQSLSGPSHIPADLTFLFTIRNLSPNYAVQGPQSSGHSWMPPSQRNAYEAEAETLYRWVGGRVARVHSNEYARLASLEPFGAATVFTQMPDTPHLLVVPFDAQMRDVRDYDAGWRRLSFNYVPVNGNDTRRTYASVVNLGAEAQIAGPGSPHIVGPVGSLLPSVYDYQQTLDGNNRPVPSEREHSGLIGSLPILLALAAFSAPKGWLDQTLTQSLRPGIWAPHGFPGGCKQTRRRLLVRADWVQASRSEAWWSRFTSTLRTRKSLLVRSWNAYRVAFSVLSTVRNSAIMP